MTNCIARNLFSVCLCVVICGCLSSQAPPDPILEIKIEQTPIITKVKPTVVSIPTSLCPDDMVFVSITHYCIDKYEAPNQKGALPLAAQTAFQAETYCKSVDKELCNRTRWYIACAGAQLNPYPYGKVYKRGTCNDNKYGWIPVPWSTMGTPAWDQWCKERYKAEPSGFRPACVSDFGVYDMTGNVAEWVREPTAYYGYVVKGGYWYGVHSPENPSCRFANIGHSANFQSYEFGFRCCKIAN